MKIHLLINVLILILFVQCVYKQKESISIEEKSVVETVQKSDSLPPLQAGEVTYKGDEPFGEIIVLKGRLLTSDTAIFRLKEAEMVIHDNILVLSPEIFEQLVLFKLPEMKCLGYVGSVGQGPGDFLRPHLIETQDTGVVCYMTDDTNYKNFFKLTNDYKLEQISSPFRNKTSWRLDEIYQVKRNKYLIAEKADNGKIITESELIGDSVITREIYNLNLRKEQSFWAVYLGSFAVNVKKKRMVYAYKYYRKIKFMDLEAKQIREISFVNEKGFDDNTLKIADGLDRNVTYYHGIYAGEKYVYIGYSGMTPVEAYRKGDNFYIHIEKYDWNGYPICKYRLDNSGIWHVDEQNRKIYLASYRYDDPFFIYDLPE
ncbi:BF3164 family lipoprotein [uncultured Parabacteroides sp.]|uniref:BF3164 family lipoprotein n=2 Tax=uncultured Parabacteroides sp. TaxID=512312 RepID=UPI0025E7E14F|nr:BF3164 family lipoprotein [uncultured Parabacteroides sp.]